MASTCYLYSNKLKQHLHRTEVPTIFEGNNKSDTTAGSRSQLDGRLGESRGQTTPTYDEEFIDHELELDKLKLSEYEADQTRKFYLKLQIYQKISSHLTKTRERRSVITRKRSTTA
eukprot:2128523-Amphidinium_carterae.2